MTGSKYQDPYRDGFREKQGQLQVLRGRYGDFEVWETIPNTLPDGRVMRRIGEHIELDDGTYVVVDVTESNAFCESMTKKVVEYKEDGDKEVKEKTRRGYNICVSTYREKEYER
jgi:hypothetical protein